MFSTLQRLTLVFLLSMPAWSQTAPAPEYENLFQRTSGWTGADGTYSAPLHNGQTLWGFSDTFFGDIVEGRRVEPFRFVNNSFILEGQADTKVLKAPVFTPPSGGGWFWLFDLVKEENFEILLGQFEGTGDGGFGFQQSGLWWARFAIDPQSSQITVREYRKLPTFERKGKELITFGPAILETPSWLYLYGVHDKVGERLAVIARVPRGQLGQPGAWRFFDGKTWSADMWKCSSLFGGAAMESSVHRTRSGAYLYVGSDESGLSSRIVARLATTPEGPWGPTFPIYNAPEHEGEIFAYNAKAHPHLSRDGRILISYNVNTSNLERVVAEADIYRPRFIWWTPPRAEWMPQAD